MEKIALGLVITIFLVVIDSSAADCTYKCNPEKPNIVLIESLEYKCPEKYICADPVKYPKCDMCILETQKCAGKFKCGINKKVVTIGSLTINCPPNTECNSQAKGDNCPPCIGIECNKPDWECIDDTNVLYKGLTFECAKTYICNKAKVEPCDPCIIKPTTTRALSFLMVLSNLNN